jgi:phage tail sheath protein
MGMPSISISFSEIAATAIKRGDRGIIAIILKDTNIPEVNPVVCVSEADIPANLSDDNKEQIRLALRGYVNAPSKVIAYVLNKTVDTYKAALDYLRTVKFNYLVVPTVGTDKKTGEIVTYVKAERAAKKLIKAVLPNTKGDNEAIINYTTEKVFVGEKAYTAEQYCARIAGLIAGTPLKMSSTYAPLHELTDCTRLTKEKMDSAVDAGEFIVWWDGEKVKSGRGVNSLTTLTADKNTQFQKVKIMDALDMISDDIRRTTEDNYIGKYPNNYDNKCLLMSAIGNYFDELIRLSVIEGYTLEMDIEANRSYLKGRGVDVSKMNDEEIKTANTGSNVFLKVALTMTDAIEDVSLNITI